MVINVGSSLENVLRVICTKVDIFRCYFLGLGQKRFFLQGDSSGNIISQSLFNL